MAIDPEGGSSPPPLATDATRRDVRAVADILSRKWHLEVLDRLQERGPYRFNELKRALGVTPKVLTDCLSELVDAELVDRTVYSESPPHVEYSIAEQGYELQQIAAEMAAWTSDETDANPRVLVVDTAVPANLDFPRWLSADYTVERVCRTGGIDQHRLDGVDLVLYHYNPLLDDNTAFVEELRGADTNVIYVTAHRQSLNRHHERAMELVDPVFECELLQAVETMLDHETDDHEGRESHEPRAAGTTK